MTDAAKLIRLKVLLGADAPSDEDLSDLLAFAGDEIRGFNGLAEDADIPFRYEQTQILAVVEAINHMGAEGEKVHNENGINRTFAYATIIDYIRTHVNSGVRLFP